MKYISVFVFISISICSCVKGTKSDGPDKVASGYEQSNKDYPIVYPKDKDSIINDINMSEDSSEIIYRLWISPGLDLKNAMVRVSGDSAILKIYTNKEGYPDGVGHKLLLYRSFPLSDTFWKDYRYAINDAYFWSLAYSDTTAINVVDGTTYTLEGQRVEEGKKTYHAVSRTRSNSGSFFLACDKLKEAVNFDYYMDSLSR